MKSPDLSIVLPCFGEGSGLHAAIIEIAAVARSSVSSLEIIIVDDGSIDDTWAIVTSTQVENVQIRGIRLSRNFGKEAAILAGLSSAQGTAVIVMDADLEHPPALIPTMVAAWRAGAQIVNARKNNRQKTPFVRSIATRGFYSLFRIATGMDLGRDSDYKLLDHTVAATLASYPERVRFFRGLARTIGFSQVDVPYDPAVGTRSNSTFSTVSLLRYALRAVVSFSSRPLRWLGYVGFIGLVAAVVLGVHTLFMKLTGRAAEGFSTVILLLLGTSSVQLLGMALLGEYLAALYEEAKSRPHYLIAAVHNEPREPEIIAPARSDSATG